MSQLQWKTVCTVGDSNPIEHSGGFVQVDQTGVYAPECTWIEAGETENDPVTVYRFILEPCTYVNGILSDNQFHPDNPAWFQDSLQQFADNYGESLEWIVEKFCSDEPAERALAWLEVGQYHGMENLDSYQLTTTPDECREWLESK